MRPLKSPEEGRAQIRRKAKAAVGKTTKRAKLAKEIDYLGRRFDEEKRVLRHYCTAFAFWRFCRLKPCRRARACRGEPKTCLWRSLERVPKREQYEAREELIAATPRHFGAVERKVRKTMPYNFFLRPISPARLEKMLAPAKRMRERSEEKYSDGLEGLLK